MACAVVVQRMSPAGSRGRQSDMIEAFVERMVTAIKLGFPLSLPTSCHLVLCFFGVTPVTDIATRRGQIWLCDNASFGPTTLETVAEALQVASISVLVKDAQAQRVMDSCTERASFDFFASSTKFAGKLAKAYQDSPAGKALRDAVPEIVDLVDPLALAVQAQRDLLDLYARRVVRICEPTTAGAPRMSRRAVGSKFGA